MTKPDKVDVAVKSQDCCSFMQKSLKDRSVNLTIADPPYNIGQDYDAYSDKKAVADYLDWSNSWIGEVRRCLHQHGSFWLFINDAFVSELDVMCRQDFGFWKRSHVIWYYTFGQNSRANFTPSHTHVLYYTKTKTKYTFNKDSKDIRHVSARQAIYKDKRANKDGRLPDNTWVLFPDQVPEVFRDDEDTWLLSRVCGTFKEREHHIPNQIPVPLMERIVLSSSKPGDIVFDPFCGSGSSGVAAVRHGRHYIGTDISANSCREARKRIKVDR